MKNRRPTRLTRGASPLVLLVLAGTIAVASGCTRTVKTEVSERNNVTVFLRHTVERGVQQERNYQHPAMIAPQRLAHILGAIDVEVQGDEKRQRRAALHPEILTPIARGLVEAFEKADSTQQVAVMAVRKEQRLGLFHRKYLTSLIAFFRDDRLYVQLSRIDWPIPRERENKKLPEPKPNDKQMAFRAIPASKMKPVGAQGVVVRWRDAIFSAPVRNASKVGGELDKRTLLMESPLPQGEADAETGIDPTKLEADALRALADLKEARRNGTITEAEYRERLENLLGEGSY